MRICYILLSPTFGMHQYTADLANRMAEEGHDVRLITTARLPLDRYANNVTILTPVTTTTTGVSAETFRLSQLRKIEQVAADITPDVIHFTGPHLWNVPLVRRLRKRGFPVIHTLHDLDPHSGTRYGILLKVWNRLIIQSADHILIHGHSYQERLLGMNVAAENVTFTPLLHLFLGYEQLEPTQEMSANIEYEPWALFFGRLEKYKGVDYLLTALAMMNGADNSTPRAILAGPGNLDALWAGSFPSHVEVRNRLIEDGEALDLFRRCGVLVLPYIDATQSALISAAYYFRKPVVVTRAGALPEYVEDGVTGYIVEPDHPAALARSLEQLLNTPQRLSEMGRAGRQMYDSWRTQEIELLSDMYQHYAVSA